MSSLLLDSLSFRSLLYIALVSGQCTRVSTLYFELDLSDLLRLHSAPEKVLPARGTEWRT